MRGSTVVCTIVTKIIALPSQGLLLCWVTEMPATIVTNSRSSYLEGYCFSGGVQRYFHASID